MRTSVDERKHSAPYQSPREDNPPVFNGRCAVLCSVRPQPSGSIRGPAGQPGLSSRRADVIVQGQIASVRRKPLPGYPNISTVEVTLRVETLRGLPGKTYTFREVYLGLRSAEGKRAYMPGQRLFLFLPSPSQYGLSSPIGIGQGRFHIAGDGAGVAKLANEQGNAGLFHGVERDAVKQENNSRRDSGSLPRPIAVLCRWKNLCPWFRA